MKLVQLYAKCYTYYIQFFQTPQIIYIHLQTYVIYFVSYITDTIYKTVVDELFQIHIRGSIEVVN